MEIAGQGDARGEAAPAEIASLEDALGQLTATASRLVQVHRELAEEANAIQTEMEGLHDAQEARARQIATRLQSAGASILAFSDSNSPEQAEQIEDDYAYAQE